MHGDDCIASTSVVTDAECRSGPHRARLRTTHAKSNARSIDVRTTRPQMTNDSTSTHTFLLVLDGLNPSDDAVEDALFEAGCDDAMLSFRGTTALLEFDREASSLEEAVLSAFRDLEASGLNSVVLRVEPDDLVSASEISRRAGASREGVRLWHEGERGPGSFPPPVASVGTNTMLWSWAEVSNWLLENDKLDNYTVVENARFLARLNALLNEERYHHLTRSDSSFKDRLGKTGALRRLRSLANEVGKKHAGG